jgi:hypothetical protein
MSAGQLGAAHIKSWLRSIRRWSSFFDVKESSLAARQSAVVGSPAAACRLCSTTQQAMAVAPRNTEGRRFMRNPVDGMVLNTLFCLSFI